MPESGDDEELSNYEMSNIDQKEEVIAVEVPRQFAGRIRYYVSISDPSPASSRGGGDRERHGYCHEYFAVFPRKEKLKFPYKSGFVLKGFVNSSPNRIDAFFRPARDCKRLENGKKISIGPTRYYAGIEVSRSSPVPTATYFSFLPRQPVFLDEPALVELHDFFAKVTRVNTFGDLRSLDWLRFDVEKTIPNIRLGLLANEERRNVECRGSPREERGRGYISPSNYSSDLRSWLHHTKYATSLHSVDGPLPHIL